MNDTKTMADIFVLEADGKRCCVLCGNTLSSDVCDCIKEANKKEEERIKCFNEKMDSEWRRRRAEYLRNEGIPDPKYRGYTFESDDRKYPDISDKCKRYVDNWDKMRDNNIGLLFLGDVGTGKSFYAFCILNALINLLVTIYATSLSAIINTLQSYKFGEDRNKVYQKLQNCDVLLLDDFGVERGTEYIMEQIYLIIDARYRSGKPIIVTTNLSPDELLSDELGYKRIYDRILENCIRIPLEGESRRLDVAERKHEQFKEILGL